MTYIPTLSAGSHSTVMEGCCAAEAVSLLAGEPWSDEPESLCPVIAQHLRVLNDRARDGERDVLLRPILHFLVGSRSTPQVERRRELLVMTWVAKCAVPSWLRAAGLPGTADELAAVAPVTDDGSMLAAEAAVRRVLSRLDRHVQIAEAAAAEPADVAEDVTMAAGYAYFGCGMGGSALETVAVLACHQAARLVAMTAITAGLDACEAIREPSRQLRWYAARLLVSMALVGDMP